MAQNKNLAPIQSASQVYRLKDIFQKPALTSFYQCWFYPTEKSRDWISQRGYEFSSAVENISLLCCEASLPGSSLVTNEITSDYHGVTEKHPYRRQYMDADFTFYVDHNGADGGKSHDIIWFFENWIGHISNESVTTISDGRPNSTKSNYFYRFEFPKNYQTDIYINKFERDFKGTYLQYNFLQAYPLSINAMPVSYDSSQLLKCTVTFSYTRYNVYREYNYGIVGSLRNNQLVNDPFAALNPFATTESETIADTIRKAVGGAAETFGVSGTKY
jgi:hypothetical protein